MYYYFKTWRDSGLWETLSQELAGDYRQSLGKERSPSVGIIDAQSVKATAVSAQTSTGYDAGKKVKGRKRHIIVDTLGLLICLWVSSADLQDHTAAHWLFVKMHLNRVDFLRLSVFFADGRYAGKLVDFESLAVENGLCARSQDFGPLRFPPRTLYFDESDFFA